MAYTAWSKNNVIADTITNMVIGVDGKTILVKSMSICNYSGVDALIEVVVLTVSGNGVAKIVSATVAAGETVFLDPNLFIVGDNKLIVESAQANVSFYASGDDNFGG